MAQDSEVGGSGCSRGEGRRGDRRLGVGRAGGAEAARATERGGGVLRRAAGPVRVAYEAGPTGFGLARALAARRASSAWWPRRARSSARRRSGQDRPARRRAAGAAADDRRAASGSGADSAEEALRDLVRCLEDVRGDLMRARHRVVQAPAAPRVRFDGQETGPTAHLTGWGGSSCPSRWRRSTLLDYVGAIDALLVRRESLEAHDRAQLVPGSPWAQTVARLRCLRGIDTLSAVGLCAEVGDFERFERPGQLMSYLGLVPSRTAPARRAGRARSPSPARVTPGGCWSRPAWHYRKRAPRRPRARAPPRRPARARDRDLLEGPAAPAPQLAPPRPRARQAPHHRRGRRGARARRLLLGGRHRRLTRPSTARSRRRRDLGHHAREHPRFSYEQPATRRARSLLDSGRSRRNPVLRPANPRISA